MAQTAVFCQQDVVQTPCVGIGIALREHLAFRDFMRSHPDWIQKLSDLKRSLCEQYNDDREAYMNGKAPMVREITELAMSSSEQADPPVD